MVFLCEESVLSGRQERHKILMHHTIIKKKYSQKRDFFAVRIEKAIKRH